MAGSAEGAAGLAGARRAVRLIFAGWYRRTVFRRESPLSKIECRRVGRLLIVRPRMLSRVVAWRVPPPPQPSVVGPVGHAAVGCRFPCFGGWGLSAWGGRPPAGMPAELELDEGSSGLWVTIAQQNPAS